VVAIPVPNEEKYEFVALAEEAVKNARTQKEHLCKCTACQARIEYARVLGTRVLRSSAIEQCTMQRLIERTRAEVSLSPIFAALFV
jgi:hypothetical protein